MAMTRVTTLLFCLAAYPVFLAAQSQEDFRECGRSFNTNNDGVSGSEVDSNEHRSFCTLYVQQGGRFGNSRPFLGGATLIQENMLLTLGTMFDKLQLLREDEGCLGYKPRQEVFARCGGRNIQEPSDGDKIQNKIIKRIHLHPEYNNRTLINDFALLVTEEPFVFTETVGRACLPHPFASGVDSFESCVAVGHGRDAPKSDPNSVFSSSTQKVSLPLIERKMCEHDLSTVLMEKSEGHIANWMLHSSHLCAGGEKTIDTCIGDGGGPLYCKKKSSDNYNDFDFSKPSKYVQLGVTAWGVGDCGIGNPGVYSKVSDSMCWIDELMSCNPVEVEAEVEAGAAQFDLRVDDPRVSSVNGLTSDQCDAWQSKEIDTCLCVVRLEAAPEAGSEAGVDEEENLDVDIGLVDLRFDF